MTYFDLLGSKNTLLGETTANRVFRPHFMSYFDFLGSKNTFNGGNNGKSCFDPQNETFQLWQPSRGPPEGSKLARQVDLVLVPPLGFAVPRGYPGGKSSFGGPFWAKMTPFLGHFRPGAELNRASKGTPKRGPQGVKNDPPVVQNDPKISVFCP